MSLDVPLRAEVRKSSSSLAPFPLCFFAYACILFQTPIPSPYAAFLILPLKPQYRPSLTSVCSATIETIFCLRPQIPFLYIPLLVIRLETLCLLSLVIFLVGFVSKISIFRGYPSMYERWQNCFHTENSAHCTPFYGA